MADIGSWKYIDRHHRLNAFSNQGLTTVVGQDGTTALLYRGDYSIPRALMREGWAHIGNPDSSQGYVFDAYQGHATSKMYQVTTPAGDHYQYLYPLEGDELMNNSYVAVSPDGQWMVSSRCSLRGLAAPPTGYAAFPPTTGCVRLRTEVIRACTPVPEGSL